MILSRFPELLSCKILTNVIKRTIKQEIWIKIDDVSLIVIISGNVFNAGNKKTGKNIHKGKLKIFEQI